MLRYIRALSDKDLALDRSMIPLGSCTMKLNATSEMIPSPGPSSPTSTPLRRPTSCRATPELDEQLRAWLCQATGYAGISLQPNAGSRVNTPACWSSRPTTKRAAKATATSA
jgi:glycine dehydrogenase